MHKFILFAVFLSVTYIANAETQDPPMQIFVTNVEDTGTYERPYLKVSYVAYPDSEEHADQLVPFLISDQLYGLINVYKQYSYTDNGGSCFGGKNCTGVRLWTSKYKNGRATFREANAAFIERFGTQGSVYSRWNYRPYEWSICIGMVPGGSYGYDRSYYLLAFPNSCAIIPPKPVSCEVRSNDTIELDHGTLDAKSLQATHSKTASLTINCGYNTSMKLDFTEPTITLAKGLTSTLSLKVDGQDFSNGKTIVFQEEKQSRIDITSTLKAVGDIEPNTYSGNSVLIINIQ